MTIEKIHNRMSKVESPTVMSVVNSDVQKILRRLKVK